MIGPTVDRKLARIVALKRIVTGSISLACGVLLGALVLIKGNPPALTGLAIAIFFGGGAWTLRDGLRLRRALLEP